MRGGQIDYGARSGTYNTARGGTINYGAAGVGARGPGGGVAGRGAYGVEGTTAGGRTFGDVGRAGGAVGPGGNAVAGVERAGCAGPPSKARGFAVRAVEPQVSVPPRSAKGSTPTGDITMAGSTATGAAIIPPPGAGGTRTGATAAGATADGAWASAWGWATGYLPGATVRRFTAWGTCRTTTPIMTTTTAVAWSGGGHGLPVQLLPADRHHERRGRRIRRKPGRGAVRRRPGIVQAGQLHRRASSRPTPPWRSCPTTRPCTSSGRFACSP